MIVEVAGDGDRVLRAVFLRDGDRWQHRLEIGDGERTDCRLMTVEGNSDDLWPPSPPIQECHLQETSQGVCLLAVGRAGKSHWSMSVSPNPDSAALDFDIACRLRQAAGFLGSTYNEASAALCGEMLLEATGDAHVLRQANEISVRANLPRVKDFPLTIRWTYRVRLPG